MQSLNRFSSLTSRLFLWGLPRQSRITLVEFSPCSFPHIATQGSPESVTPIGDSYPPPSPGSWSPTSPSVRNPPTFFSSPLFNGFCVQKMEGLTGAECARNRRIHDFLGQVQHAQRPSSRRSGGCGWREEAPRQRDGAGAEHQPWGAAEEAELTGGCGVQAAKR